MEYLVKNENGYSLAEEQLKKIVALEQAIKEAKAQQDELRSALLAEMEDTNTKKIETDDVIITYVDKTTRESFNSKRLRADNPFLYDEYIDIKDVAPSIRIKVK